MNRTLLRFLSRSWLAAVFPWILLGWMVSRHRAFLLPVTLALLARVYVRWVASGEWRPNFWLWRISRRVIRFHAVPGDRASILFPAGLEQTIDLREILRWSESDMDEFSERFGTHLGRRLIIVLISSHRDLTKDVGRPVAGTLVMAANAVVLATDCPLRETLRHELTHLFAFRWNMHAPPIMQEGLANWSENTGPDWSGTGFDPCLERGFQMDPTLLLDSRYFLAPCRVHVSYALAGIFTGFLVRRFGWDRYKQFYRRANHWNFRSVFEKQFGVTLEEAWRRCPDETVAMASLSRRLREDQLFNPLL